MYPCVESTIDLDISSRQKVRLWINEESLPLMFREEELRTLASKIEAWDLNSVVTEHGLGFKDRIKELQELIPNLNAVQMQYKLNDNLWTGTVVYLVDFNDKDPHG